MKARVNYATRKNNILTYPKPNEDFLLVDQEHGIYIVADGVSRYPRNENYPNPSPARQVAQLLSKIVHQELLQNRHLEPPKALEKAISIANQTI